MRMTSSPHPFRWGAGELFAVRSSFGALGTPARGLRFNYWLGTQLRPRRRASAILDTRPASAPEDRGRISVSLQNEPRSALYCSHCRSYVRRVLVQTSV